MELRTHTRILKNAKWFIVVFTVLVGLAAFVFALVQPQAYKAVVSFEVNFINRPATMDYQYGAYYDLRAAEIYTQHLMGFFKMPAVVAEVYEAAGQDYEIESIPQFIGRFTAKQYSAQSFSIEFRDLNRGTAENLANAVVRVVEKHAQASSSINEQAVFGVTALEPIVANAEYNIWIVTVVGVLAGLILSLILVYLREYFRD